MVHGQHEDESLRLINAIKKADVSDAIAPRFWYGISQFLDVTPEIRIRSKLWIHERRELLLDAGLLSAKILLEVFLELHGFENLKFSQ